MREALDRQIEVPFKFEHAGSQIIFCDQEPDYAAAEAARRMRSIAPFSEMEPTTYG